MMTAVQITTAWPRGGARPFTTAAPVALVADTAALDEVEGTGPRLADLDGDSVADHLAYADEAAAWLDEVVRAAVALVPAYATRDEAGPVPVVVLAESPLVADLVADRLAAAITAVGITARVVEVDR